MASITDNPSMGTWIPERAQEGINLEQFTHQIIEPSILQAVGRTYREAQSQLEYFVEEQNSYFQGKMVGMATE